MDGIGKIESRDETIAPAKGSMFTELSAVLTPLQGQRLLGISSTATSIKSATFPVLGKKTEDCS